MGKSKVLVGARFGKLIAVEKMPNRALPSGAYVAVWRCKCDCGDTKTILAASLLSGATTSCGCYLKSILPYVHRTHGMAHTAFYRAWRSMLNRCDYKEHYKVRGITVCPQWREFEVFMEDMLESYAPNLTLERKDNNAGYSKHNCVWASKKAQTRNRSTTKQLTLFCETRPLAEWAELFGIPYARVNDRVWRGWSHEKAVFAPRGYRG